MFLFQSGLFAQKIDTLNLQSPKDFYFKPGQAMFIYLQSNLDSLNLSFDSSNFQNFNYNVQNRIITFNPNITDKDEHLIYITIQSDTINVIGFYPIIQTEMRTGFNRYSVNKILDSSSYSSIIIDSSSLDWTIKINGSKIIFKDEPQNLFYKYVYKIGQNSSRFKKIEIGADTLVIKDRLYFPFSNLLINANVIINEYSGNLPVIDITPIRNNQKINIEYYKKGEDGKNADTLSVYYNKLINNTNTKIIFSACGGNGQNAPKGKNGIDFPILQKAKKNLVAKIQNPDQHCSSTQTMNVIVEESDPREKGLVWIDWQHFVKNKGGSGLHGTDWEANCIYKYSENLFGKVFSDVNIKKSMPVLGGKPGEPGKGGVVVSNNSIEAFTSVIGGKSGELDSLRVSGKILGPKDPFMLSINSGINFNGKKIPTTYTFQELKYPKDSIYNPQLPQNAFGTNGLIISNSNPKKWLNVDYVKFVVDHANDLFRFGEIESAQKTFAFYKEQFFDDSLIRIYYKDDIVFWESDEIVNSALLKISSNLDYYGNPYGYVPGLGIVANYAVYKESIKSLSKAYAACLYLEKQIYTDEGIYNSAVKNIDNYLQSSLNFEKEFEDIQMIHMPLTERKIDSTILYLGNVSKRIKELDLEFKRKAKNIVDRRERRAKEGQLIKNLSLIAKVIPVGQPVLGIGATVFESFASDDNQSSVFDGLTSMISDYNTLQSTSKQFSSFTQTVNYSLTSSPANLPIYKKLYNNRDTILKSAGPYFSSVEKILKGLDLKKVSKESVAAEIEKLKNKHPEYKDLIDSVQKLTLLNKELLDGLLSLQLQLRSITKSINYNCKLIDEFKTVLSTTSITDKARVQILQTLKKEIVNKLNYYQYFYAKAYEYFTLKQYKGYERTFFYFKGNRLEKYSNYDSLISKIQDIYLLDANEAADESFTTLNANTSLVGQSTSLSLLLKKEDVNKLNLGEIVNLNIFRDQDYNLLKKAMIDFEDILIEKINLKPYYNANSINQFVTETYGRSNIKIEHLGSSRRYKNGVQYDFNNKSGDNIPFYQWSVDKSFKPNKELVYRELDETYKELVNVISGGQISNIRKVISFDSDLRISKEDEGLIGKSVMLDSVELTIDLVLNPRGKYNGIYLFDNLRFGSHPQLKIISNNNVYTGEKVIYKSFLKNQIVRIGVPEIWNNKKFKYWIINDYKVYERNYFDIQVSKKFYKISPVYEE